MSEPVLPVKFDGMIVGSAKVSEDGTISDAVLSAEGVKKVFGEQDLSGLSITENPVGEVDETKWLIPDKYGHIDLRDHFDDIRGQYFDENTVDSPFDVFGRPKNTD